MVRFETTAGTPIRNGRGFSLSDIHARVGECLFTSERKFSLGIVAVLKRICWVKIYTSQTGNDFETVEVQCSICGAVLGEVSNKEWQSLNLNQQYCIQDQHQHRMNVASLGHTNCTWGGCEASWQNGLWKHPD